MSYRLFGLFNYLKGIFKSSKHDTDIFFNVFVGQYFAEYFIGYLKVTKNDRQF